MGEVTETDWDPGTGTGMRKYSGQQMLQADRSGIWIAGTMIITFCILVCGSAAAIEAYTGDTVPLAGYAAGSPNVYLFLTGPNLPVNGVSLDNIALAADQGGMVQVHVDSNGRWSYDWATNAVGGRLDAGTYIIWVSSEPVDRSRLRSGEFGTLSVTLKRPVLSLATTPPPPGAIEIRSVPEEASVMTGSEYRGQTPLSMENLAPGTYTLTLSHFRYEPRTVSATVEAGSTTVVNVVLVPSVGSLGIMSSPAGAKVFIDGNETGITPITLDNLYAGNHSVTLQLEGYASVQKPVTVLSGKSSNISFDLEPAGGFLNPAATRAGTTAPVPALLLSVVILLLTIALFHRRRT